MKSLSQVIEELKSDIARAEYVDSDYVDSVEIENLKLAVKWLEKINGEES